MPLPLIKLGVLFVKQMSKPLANAVKRSARASPTFKKICMKPAELYHSYEINIKMRILGLGKPTQKQALSPDKAVELGAEMIGEITLYTFLVGILYAEYSYSARNSEREKDEKKQYLMSLERHVTELELNSARVEAELRELQRKVGELDSKSYSLMEKVYGKGKKS
ncbi:optic atrophy 3 protein homolog [Mercenaria mercenaria]|uniref:optic atrophy 3 protein homolog n=1 Tax=Mercenaria mercenaria TaxID=6596 RepID=UPI00234FB1A2|nr:optic atrophy 3 protein homolog [Mercenaria mercenaria]